MIWTNERMELLQNLWLNGKSAAAISRELGQGISRNAVIGKASRLGLTGQLRAPPLTFPKRAETISALRCRPASRINGGAARLSRPLVAIAGAPNEMTQDFSETVVVPLTKRVTLEELEADMCRWPLGDPPSPDFRYCGAHKLDKTPYCAYHRRIACKSEQELRRERQRPADLRGGDSTGMRTAPAENLPSQAAATGLPDPEFAMLTLPDRPDRLEQAG